MMELRRQGMSEAEIRGSVHFLCGPLNVAALAVFVGALVAWNAEWRRKRKLGSTDSLGE